MLRALRHVRTTTSERGIDMIIGYPHTTSTSATGDNFNAATGVTSEVCQSLRRPIAHFKGRFRQKVVQRIRQSLRRPIAHFKGRFRQKVVRRIRQSTSCTGTPGDSHQTACTTTTTQPTSPRSTMKFNTLLQKRSDDCTPYHGVVGPVRSGDGK